MLVDSDLLTSKCIGAAEPNWSYLRDVLCLLPQWPELHAFICFRQRWTALGSSPICDRRSITGSGS